MILYQSSILRLDYSPHDDILEIGYPDFQGYILGEIRSGAKLVVEHVRDYNIKKVLMDSSQVENFLGEADFREVSSYLMSGLAMTNLRRLARLQSPNRYVDSMARDRLTSLARQVAFPFRIGNFPNKEEALRWLKG